MNRNTAFLTPFMLGRGGLLWNINDRRIMAGDDIVFGAAAIMRSMDSRAMGSGAGESIAEARIRAIGEAVERYCLTAPRPFKNAFAKELSARAIDLNNWPSYSDDQIALTEFPYEMYDHHRRRDWFLSRSLFDDENVWVPARSVFIGNTVDDGFFGVTTSTGAACHFERTQAILSGLYEVAERDAFTIVWESRSETPLIKVDSDGQDSFVRIVSRTSKNNGRQLFLRNMTTDIGVPSVVAVIRDSEGRVPALVVGCSARRTFREACKAATAEAIQTWSWMHEERLSRPLTLHKAKQLVVRPEGMIYHPLLYSFPESIASASHFIAATETSEMELCSNTINTADELDWLLSRIKSAGFEAFVADVTLPECKEFGLVVVKTLIPGLVPLSAGVWYRHLANRRIVDVPKKLGWPHHEPMSNGVPHPLP